MSRPSPGADAELHCSWLDGIATSSEIVLLRGAIGPFSRSGRERLWLVTSLRKSSRLIVGLREQDAARKGPDAQQEKADSPTVLLTLRHADHHPFDYP